MVRLRDISSGGKRGEVGGEKRAVDCVRGCLPCDGKEGKGRVCVMFSIARARVTLTQESKRMFQEEW